MSLEQALAANTAAVEKLTTILQAANPDGGDAPAKKPRAKKEETVTTTSAPQTVETAVGPKVTQTVVTMPVQPATSGVGLKDVADFFMALAGKDRNTAVAIVAKYGAAKLSEVPAASLGDVLTACHAEAGKLGGGLVRNAAGTVEFTANAAPASAASSLI